MMNRNVGDWAAGLDARSVLEPVACADPLRPRFHFAAPAGWMNDPNGTIYHDGWHHVFYQHNPASDRWDQMHWGHARSRDLIDWEHLPVALRPRPEQGEAHCYSGCCVIGDDGRPTIFYTSIGPGRQAEDAAEQFSATGSSDLIHWRQADAASLTNALQAPIEIHDWRDPFVFRDHGRWWMLVGGSRRGGRGCVALYQSDDLRDWRYAGIPIEGSEGTWECPNLLRLGEHDVLLYSPYNRVRYIVGRMDAAGCRFDADHTSLLDWAYPHHFYATNSLTTTDGRCAVLAWISGFGVGRGWSGCLAFPREVWCDGAGRLRQRPVREIERLRLGQADEIEQVVSPDPMPVTRRSTTTFELRLRLTLGSAPAVRLSLGSLGDLRWDGQTLQLGQATAPVGGEAAVDLAMGDPAGDVTVTEAVTDDATDAAGCLDLQILVDQTVVEIFASASVAFTELAGDVVDASSLTLRAEGGNASARGKLWTLRAAYFS